MDYLVIYISQSYECIKTINLCSSNLDVALPSLQFFYLKLIFKSIFYYKISPIKTYTHTLTS